MHLVLSYDVLRVGGCKNRRIPESIYMYAYNLQQNRGAANYSITGHLNGWMTFFY